MEFGERKRRRKSQSFKVVTDEDFEPYLANSSCTDANGEYEESPLNKVWLEEEGTGIKRQTTGMMRLQPDKASRVYQRVRSEGDVLATGPQDQHPCWAQRSATSPHVPESHRINNWTLTVDPEPSSSSSVPTANGCGCCQHITRSRGLRIPDRPKDPADSRASKTRPTGDVSPPCAPEGPCCMCNCKGTLQAILQELRAMRRFMHTQRASLGKQERAGSPRPACFGPGSALRYRARKRRPLFKAAAQHVSSGGASVSVTQGSRTRTPASPPSSLRAASSYEQLEETRPSTPSTPVQAESSKPPVQNISSQPSASQHLEVEVRLAEEYDVFIPKAQLESILVNYTRSGSLLFRKLVCAFFDDTTLANSLPNGKRKRGLNDHRKGLDQNIVGAIKVFTEKYCTAHRIEKLPGPRDWVQILQDQIKLARRRMKRDAEDVNSKPASRCDSKKSADAKQSVEDGRLI